MDNNLLGIIMGSFFLLLGIAFLLLIIFNIMLSNKTAHWISTKGKISRSILKKNITRYSIDLDDYGDSTDINYHQQITFEYQIDDKKYISDKIYYLDFNNWFLTSKTKKEIHKKYGIGKVVTIFINPDKKEKGFLIEKPPINLISIYSIISFVAGIYFILS